MFFNLGERLLLEVAIPSLGWLTILKISSFAICHLALFFSKILIYGWVFFFQFFNGDFLKYTSFLINLKELFVYFCNTPLSPMHVIHLLLQM